MNQKQELLSKISQAVHDYDWEAAERLLSQALEIGFTHDQYGVPLRFLLKDLPNLRSASTARTVTQLIDRAVSLAEAGQVQSARACYEEILALPFIEPAMAEQIEADLALLNSTDDFDPLVDRQLEEALAHLLERIENEQPNLAKLLRACAIPLWWDEALLADIRNLQDGREQIILQKLNQLSFVLKWPDHYVYSRLARPMLLSEWDHEDSDFKEINHRIAIHFQQRLDADVKSGHIAQYERWEISYVYHLLLDSPSQGIIQLIDALRQAEDSYRLARFQEYITILRDIQERIPPAYRTYIDYAEGWMYTLQNRHRLAENIFQELLAADDLLPDLQARVQRDLGSVFVEQRKWSQAIPHYQKTLDYFKLQNSPDEVAETMERLGSAYMDIAVHAYSHEDRFEHQHFWSGKLLQIFGQVCYFPLILYMLYNFNLGWNLQAWWHWGRDMDWAIAKFFANAIEWFQQAEQVYIQTDDRRGLNRVRFSLGRLHLDLHYIENAISIFRELESEQAHDSYQLAHIRLYLAKALLAQYNYDLAQDLLHKALPIFIELDHHRHMAQAKMILGKLAVLDDDPDRAMGYYSKALENWRAVGDEVAATSVVHRMEELDLSNGNSQQNDQADHINRAQSRKQLEQAQQKMEERVYESRYIHPLMKNFQRIAVILLCFLIPFIIQASIINHPDIAINPIATLKFQTIQLEHEPEDTESAFEDQMVTSDRIGDSFQNPEVTQVIAQFGILEILEVRPRFVGGVVISMLLSYLILYAVIGFYLLSRIKTEDVELQQTRKLYVNHRYTREWLGGQFTKLLEWSQVRVYLKSNRRLLQWPIDFWSSTTLIGTGGKHIQIDGYTKGYTRMRQWIKQYLAVHVQHLDIGFSFPHSILGLMTLASITLISVFISTTFIPSMAIDRLFSAYFMANFYNILFLGIYIPFIFWFILQPLRGYLAYYTNYSRQLWVLSLITLALAGFGWLQFKYSLLYFKRPDIFFSMTAMFSGSFVLYQLYITQKSKRFSILTFRTGTIALFSICLAFWLTIQELSSYRYLTQANNIFYEAANLAQSDPIEQYEESLKAYQNAHALRKTATTFSGQGNVYVQRSQYQQAAGYYEKAQKMALNEQSYRQNLAWAYREWAGDIRNVDQKVALYKKAIQTYDQEIADIRQRRVDYPYQNQVGLEKKSYEIRAATYFDLAMIYYRLDQDRWWASRNYFELAKLDYEWLIINAPNDPTGHVGLGWTLHYLREFEPPNTAERRTYLEEAIESFHKAIELDDKYEPAYNGLGWAHYVITWDENIFSDCRRNKFRHNEDKKDYIEQIKLAADAFTQGVQAAEEKNGYFFSTRASIQSILGSCGEPYDKLEQYRKAITDYHKALALESRAEWYYNLGMLHDEIGLHLEGEGEDGSQEWQNAANAFLKIIEIKPEYMPQTSVHPIRSLQKFYTKIGKSEDKFLDDIWEALGLEGSNDYLLTTVEDELKSENYGLVIPILSRVIERSPDHNQARLMLAQTMYQWATHYDARYQLERYQAAVKLADQALDVGIKNVEIYTILARSHAYLGNSQQTQDAVRQAESLLDENNPRHQYIQGAIHVSRGDEQRALSAYQRGNVLMEYITDPAIAEQIYAEAIGDVLMLPVTLASESDQLKLAGQMAISVADRALTDQGISYTNGDEAFFSAESAYEGKDYKIAIPRYIKSLTFTPDDSNIWSRLRSALFFGYGMGQVPSGSATLTAIVGASQQIDNYDAWVHHAKLDLSKDIFGFAVVALERAQKFHPESIEANLLQANIYLRWARLWGSNVEAPEYYRNAIDSAQRVLQIEPTNLEALLVTVHSYIGLDEDEQVSEIVTKLSEGDSESLQGHLLQAHIHFKYKKYGQATIIIEEILAQDPEYIPGYLTLIGIHHERKEYSKAIEVALKITTVDPTYRDAYIALGRIYRVDLEQYDESLAAYQTAIKLDSLNYRTFWSMDWDVTYQSDLFIVSADQIANVGWYAYIAGDYAVSVDASQQAINLRASEPRYYSNQGLAYVAMGNIDLARKSYLGTIEAANRPENKAIRFARLDEAIGDLRGISADPKGATQQFIDILEAEKDIDEGP